MFNSSYLTLNKETETEIFFFPFVLNMNRHRHTDTEAVTQKARRYNLVHYKKKPFERRKQIFVAKKVWKKKPLGGRRKREKNKRNQCDTRNLMFELFTARHFRVESLFVLCSNPVTVRLLVANPFESFDAFFVIFSFILNFIYTYAPPFTTFLFSIRISIHFHGAQT